jgi:hypothetical protein
VNLIASGLIAILCGVSAASSKPERRLVRIAFISFVVLIVVAVVFRVRNTLVSPSDPVRQGLTILAMILRNCAAGVAIFVPLMAIVDDRPPSPFRERNADFPRKTDS